MVSRGADPVVTIWRFATPVALALVALVAGGAVARVASLRDWPGGLLALAAIGIAGLVLVGVAARRRTWTAYW